MIETEAQALRVPLAHQRETGGVEMQPAAHMTDETSVGWAFFDVNGYLVTVTPDGNVLSEAGIEGADR